MISILSRILIRDYQQYDNPEVREKYGVLSGSVGIFLNIVLFIIKFVAGMVSHSIAITADAFNNLSDAGSSVITLLGFKLSAAKPDPEHPFGHGRIEYVTGLVVSGIIVLMGVELLKDSISKIIHPEETIFSPLVLGILILSILVKLYMAFYNRSLAAKLDSAAMKATGTDSLSDSLATSIVLLSMVIGYYTSFHIDGYCGVIVAVIVIIAGSSAGKETMDPLLGQPPEPEFVQKIQDIVLSQEGIIGIHDLVVHNYGPARTMISLHAEVPANVDVLISHDIIDQTEHLLNEELQCEAVIHMDPVVTDDLRVDSLKRQMKTVVETWNQQASIHDFRVVFGNTHTNLIFDVVVPFSVKASETEIVETLQEMVSQQMGEEYFIVIDIDRIYV